MEIMGFLVIVILLVFIGVIFFVFSSTQERDFSGDLRKNIEMENLVDSMMDYKYCNVGSSKGFREVVRDCYLRGGGDYCGAECKDYIKTTVENIIDAYGVGKHNFEIKDDEGVFVLGGESCEGGVIKSIYYIDPRYRDLVFELGVCESG